MTFMTMVALIVGGGGISFLLCRLAKVGRFLTVVLLASYGLRVALAIGFYVVSTCQIPIFRDLQSGGGFWQFAQDAYGYHWNAVRIAEAFRWGTETPPLNVDEDFSLVIVSVYLILGAHPLYIPLLNSTLWSLISILVYLLARRMHGEEAGRIAVLMVSVLPSPYIWSSQILKDTLGIFLLLSVLFLCVLILGQGRYLWLAAIVGLVPTAFLLARLRFYLLPILVLTVGGAVVSTLVRLSPHRQWGTAVRGLILMGLLLASFVLARNMDPAMFLSPPQPESRPLGVSQPESKPSGVPQPESKPSGVPQPESRPLGVSQPEISSSGVPQLESRSSEPFLKPVIRKGIGLISHAFSIDGIVAFSIDGIVSRRRGFASSGGASNAGEDVKLHGFWSIVTFLPRGLAYALFAPFPWEWFSTEGDTGIFRLLSRIEVVLIFAVTPFLLVGVGRAACSGRPDAWLLLVFGAVMATLLGLVVTNIGILFRLRLQFLIPMFVIVAAYGLGDRWRTVCGLLAHWFLKQPDPNATTRIRREGS